ncbi:hypothetical protein [Deinococcus aerophilus]|nr:hypothetical protein [Deinococcus aerophilus]
MRVAVLGDIHSNLPVLEAALGVLTAHAPNALGGPVKCAAMPTGRC